MGTKCGSSKFNQYKFKFLEEDKFCDSYQRNNKQGGRKNMRCFPYCAKPGHKTSQPCAPLLNLEYSRPLNSPAPESTIIIARFVCVTEKPGIVTTNPITGTSCEVQIGESVESSTILDNLRTSKKPTSELIQGALVNTSVEEEDGRMVIKGRVAFLERAWHYGWVSGRYLFGTKHALRCYIFEAQRDSHDLVCASIITSPEFSIFSSRFKYNSNLRNNAKWDSSTKQDADPPVDCRLAKKRMSSERTDKYENAPQADHTTDGFEMMEGNKTRLGKKTPILPSAQKARVL
jgi:hypothetical protein